MTTPQSPNIPQEMHYLIFTDTIYALVYKKNEIILFLFSKVMPVPPISSAKEDRKMREFESPDEYLLKWRQHNPQLLSQVSQSVQYSVYSVLYFEVC